MKQKLSFVLLSLTFLYSCTRDNNTNNSCALNTSSFSGAYKITSEKVQADSSSPAVENIQNWEACEKDNIYDFTTVGSFSISEGLESCTTPPRTKTGAWNLRGDSLSMSFSNGLNLAFPVTNFDCTSFKLISVEASSGEIRTTTYQRQ